MNNAKQQSVEGTGNLNRGVEEMPQPSPMIPFGYENPTRVEITDFIPPVDNTGGGTEENEENEDDLNELYDGIEVNVNASEDDFVDSDVDDDYDQLVDHTDGGQQGINQNDNHVRGNENDAEAAKQGSSGLTRKEKLQMWKNDPDFRQLVKEVMAEDLNERQSSRDDDQKGMNKSPKVINVAKSPSDTTIYRPAFKKVNESANDVIVKISNFLDGMRIATQQTDKQSGNVGTKVTPTPKRSQKERAEQNPNARDEAEKVIIEAEQYRAGIQKPSSEAINLELAKLLNRSLDDDDEFLHVTCHIDGNLKIKIECREYVDLEWLLPKDPAGGGGNIDLQDENKVEIVAKGRHTYFKPVRDSQINGLRKWEQAFRVYAAIYTQANPERAGEIWQYMLEINVAASSYQWTNVTYYDVTFRQLMAFKPSRSWAKTYHQGWNLAMREPIETNRTVTAGTSNQTFENSRSTQNNGGRRDWRDDCCNR